MKREEFVTAVVLVIALCIIVLNIIGRNVAHDAQPTFTVLPEATTTTYIPIIDQPCTRELADFPHACDK